MAKFVLEIGTEEIPARFLAPEEEAAASLLSRALDESGISHSAPRVFSSPRRLGIIIDDMAEKQAEREEEVSGPPVAAAYAQDGQPTRALLGFLSGQNARLEDVYRLHTPKGEYVAVRKRIGGRPTIIELARILPEIIAKLPFAKRMRWGSGKFAYARPIRWILALLDDTPIEFEIGPVLSGKEIYGHRVDGIGPFEVASAADYEKTLAEKCKIVVDRNQRKDIIRSSGDQLARAIGGKVLWNEALLDEVTGLVEKPVPMLGDFDPSYLEVPSEALLSSMEGHQKSFGLVAEDGKLLPHFLTVLNIDPLDLADVKRGWERVLRARLEDARFFWRADTGDTFDNWLKKLDHVIFIGPLGSMGEKSGRISSLCRWLAERLFPEQELANLAARAGQLAKADLVSSMVGEFDTLQGIMGGIYAAKAGEEPAVAAAIKEQYLPSGPDTPIPATQLGCVLSIADKADTLAGCFGLDKIPTGAADPNGLRRCALGIIRILLERGWRLNVADLFAEARKLYGERKWKLSPQEALAKLMEFFHGRLRNHLIARGYETNMVDAALGGGGNDPADTLARLDALIAFSRKSNFLASAQLLKRVENICKKAQESGTDYRPEEFVEDAEKNLAEKLSQLAPQIDKALRAHDYDKVLSALDVLQSPVNEFFEKVMVMSEDMRLRENRLRLLNALSSHFAPVARFSCMQI